MTRRTWIDGESLRSSRTRRENSRLGDGDPTKRGARTFATSSSGGMKEGSGRGSRCWISACGAMSFKSLSGAEEAEMGNRESKMVIKTAAVLSSNDLHVADAWPNRRVGRVESKRIGKRPWRRAGRCMACSKLFHRQSQSKTNTVYVNGLIEMLK
jgi:hypothetical protein